MYFRMRNDVASMSQYWEATNNQGVRLGRGRLLADGIATPPFAFGVTYSPGLDGAPKVQPFYDYVSNVKVMHRRLVAALTAAGVDNLQTFPAVVTDTVSGRVHDDFLVVNVLGLVECADMASSTAQPIATAYYFDTLVLDDARARGLHLFRLKESPIEIIVDDRVKEVVDRGGFRGIVFEAASRTPAP